MKKWITQHGALLYKVVGIFIVLAFCVGIPTTVLGDVGNNVDYSSGGNSNSYSSGSSVSGLDIYTIMMLIRWIIREPWMLIPILFIAFVFSLIKLGQNKQTSSYTNPSSRNRMAFSGNDYRSHSAMPTSHKETLSALIEKDPAFSEQMIVSKVNNMFMRLQLAWMNKKWEEARPFENDALFNTHKMQLDQYIASKRTNKIEDIAILNTDVLKYYAAGEFEYLDILIKARFIDYVIEDEKGQLVKGDKFRLVHMTYVWKLVRKQGVPTNNEHVEATACPNCGANISINQAGRCEYCDSIVTRGDFDWVVSEMEVISQHK